MPYGVIGFRTWEAPSSTLPSPAVWADALGAEAVSEGLGYQVLVDFKNGSTGLIFTGGSGSGLSFDHDYDSVIQLSTGTGNTANTAQINSLPVGIPTLHSQQLLKFEAIVAVTQTAAANSVFVGLANWPSMSTQIITTASSTGASNALVNGSKIGFWMLGSSTQNFNAVYQNGTTALATVSTGVLNASAFSAGSTQNQLQGAQTGTGPQPPTTPYPLTASTFVKLAITYDGENSWTWYVNGIQVAKMDGTGLVDNATSYGGIVAVAAPGSTQVSLNTVYFRDYYGPKA